MAVTGPRHTSSLGGRVPQFTVHFETFGCRLNQIESESAARSFADCGFAVDMESLTAAAPAPDNTVISVVNTCTVTGKAEQKARRLIRLLLRKMPSSCVLVTGCYAQLEAEAIRALDPHVCVLPGSRKDLLADIPQELSSYLAEAGWREDGDGLALTGFMTDLVARLSERRPAPDNIKARSPEPEQEVPGASRRLAPSKSFATRGLSRFVPVERPSPGTASPATSPVFRLSTDTFLAHSRSSIKIQDGCNCECTYCRIHLARGSSVSLDVASVVERIQRLEAAGQQEVVLTGVNLSQYRGRWNGTQLRLAGLLSRILDRTRFIRIRISSLYPESVDEELCAVIAHRRIQPYFHLSVQSGSDRILRLMRRPYRSAQVYRAVQLLRQAKEHPFIACDIIAGFPGETEEDFELTRRMCRACQFAWIHAFPFSARPGTPAATMQGQVPQSVAGERVRWLTSFAIESKCSYISLWKGKLVSAITERNRHDRRNGDGSSTGQRQLTHAVTENFIHVELPGSHPQGAAIRVRIGGPLPDRIRAGDECDAFGEAVHDEDVEEAP